MPKFSKIAIRYSGSITVIFFSLLVVCMACTRTVKLSQPYNQNFAAGEGLSYVIKTTNGQKYETDSYATTDSSIVIQAIIVDSYRNEIDPIEVPYSDIESLKRVEVSSLRAGLLVAGATAVIIALLYATMTVVRGGPYS
jgi:hypothetical protein